MKRPSDNKILEPAENKAAPAEGRLVRIRFRPGRGATGVNQDANRFAEVDAKMADTLISLSYADAVVEPSASVEPEEEPTEPTE